jgi:hypothetical protein
MMRTMEQGTRNKEQGTEEEWILSLLPSSFFLRPGCEGSIGV